ncbi:DUF1622 domain-containing protein [Rhodovibrionaceae bacterium A322]
MDALLLKIEWVANLIDGLAVLVLLFGLVFSIFMVARGARDNDLPFADALAGPMVRQFRVALGRWILVALEILIVSDILHSIVHRNLDEILFLGGIVIIRVTLAYFLDHEISRIEALRKDAEK